MWWKREQAQSGWAMLMNSSRGCITLRTGEGEASSHKLFAVFSAGVHWAAARRQQQRQRHCAGVQSQLPPLPAPQQRCSPEGNTVCVPCSC